MPEETFRLGRRPVAPDEIPNLTAAPPAKPAARPAPVEAPKPASPNISKLPQHIQAAILKNAQEVPPEPRAGDVPTEDFAGDGEPEPEPVGGSQAGLVDQILASLKDKYTWEPITLPSRGVFYDGKVAPKDGVLHVRQMTGREDSILSSYRLYAKGLAMNMIFKNCTREPIIPEKLLAVDRTYLLIYLRMISMDVDYHVHVRCPHCETKFETVIDLDQQVGVTYCPDDFDPAALTDTLPVSRLRYSYIPETFETEKAVSEYVDSKAKEKGDEANDAFMFRASRQLTSLAGVTDRNDLFRLLNGLPIADIQYLKEAMVETPFAVDTLCDVVCDQCNKAFKVEMPMEESFFFPKRKKGKNTPATS